MNTNNYNIKDGLDTINNLFEAMSINDEDILKVQLKEYLKTSKITHESQIITKETLKLAHIYCILNRLSAQQYGPLLEKFIINKFNFKKNNASAGIGDCSKDNKNVEIKASLGGAENNKFNYVQIRLNHNIDYYLLTAYNISDNNVNNYGDLYIFKLTKSDIIKLIFKYGGYAHGTIKKFGEITMENLNNESDKEYAIRPKLNDKCWNELLNYRISEDEL
jgi:hypothetical protein